MLDIINCVEFLDVDGALFRLTTGGMGEAGGNSFIGHESNTVHLNRLLYHIQANSIHNVDV
jgi:hypothetical protein